MSLNVLGLFNNLKEIYEEKISAAIWIPFIGIGLITAQTQKVTGTVISDDDKQPVVGASIVVKGTNLGTITDIDGHFTLLMYHIQQKYCKYHI